MANYTQGDIRPILQPDEFEPYQGNGSLVLDSRRTRPAWFDGRFLAARDLAREQNYFLRRQADLGKAPGFETTAGLLVDVPQAPQSPNAPQIIIRAGHGITPSGDRVSIPSDLTVSVADLAEEKGPDVPFGTTATQSANPAQRTGVFAVVLKAVQFSANPITAYPLTVSGPRGMHEGDTVAATAISLVPYPDPSNDNNAATRHAALTRQIFLNGDAATLSDSLLPLALISLQSGSVEWLDPWLVRRESGPQFTGLRFGLTDRSSQQAFLQQYDSLLQQAVNALLRQKKPATFAATDYFQALPPAGRFPIGGINANAFTHSFFPSQMDIRLSVVPEDELPVLLEESMSLPPVDLTLSPEAFANITVLALIPVPRSGLSKLAATLPAVKPSTILPEVLSSRKPIDLLRFYRGDPDIFQPSMSEDSIWQAVIGSLTYGYYLRRRSSAPMVVLRTSPLATSTTAAPTTTTTTQKPKTPTTVTLKVVSAPGIPVQLQVTVLPAAATGSVALTQDGAALGTANLTAGAGSLLAPQPSPGAHTFAASYSGDANFASGNSAPVTQTF